MPCEIKKSKLELHLNLKKMIHSIHIVTVQVPTVHDIQITQNDQFLDTSQNILLYRPKSGFMVMV